MQKITLLLALIVSIWLLPACERESLLETFEVQSSLENDISTGLMDNGQSGSVTSQSSDNDFVQFPTAIQEYLNLNYPTLIVVEAGIEEDDDDGLVYQVELSDGMVLLFDEFGNFIESVENNGIDISSVPVAITDYVLVHYPNNAIENAEVKANGDYLIYVDNSLLLLFDAFSNFQFADFEGGDDETVVPLGTLPSTINDYLDTNFAGIGINEAKQYDSGSYEVELVDDTKVFFDVDGNFLLLEPSSNVAIEDLPIAITDYIALNYPGATIAEAELEDNGTYEIELDTEVELYFDSGGNILYIDEENEDENEETPIPLSSVPEDITDYVAANYPTFTIVEVEVQSNGDYEVRLNNGVELYFNANGDFLYEENEFELEFTNLTLPDTVTLNTVDTLHAYVANRSINPFNGEINASMGIEDILPPVLTATLQDQLGVIGPRTILPGDSILVSVPLMITPDHFTPESYDIAVVWPDIPNATNVVLLGNSHTAVGTYVKMP